MQQILVIEDQDLMRLALIQELKNCLTESVLVGAPTLDIAKTLMKSQDFDLILIDPGLPGVNPISLFDRLSVIEQVVDASPSATHVVITGSDSVAEAGHCRRFGVAGYVGKTGLMRGLLAEVLQDISQNGFSIRTSPTNQLAADFHYSGLTGREQEILDCMRRRERGMKRKEVYEQIGERIGVDPATVEKYYKQARAKLLRRGRLPDGI
ncbi:response regulator [Mesorhizobium caraganae]|uniref:response regulator n=1 Tax=Mesorhizobium caraganae TaxID=483206 RepID=UPI00177F741B|nr:response regulator [Mesorhizobium caraganae]